MAEAETTLSTELTEPGADLPALYVKACGALAVCAELDEIKDISDKHKALAVYAEQAKDQTLLDYAKRIQLRAFERIGEILINVKDKKARQELAKQFGINPTMAVRAYEACHVPKKVRDKLIDSSPIPTKQRLYEAGRGYMPKHRPRFDKHVRREHGVAPTPEMRAATVVEIIDLSFNDIHNERGQMSWDQIAAHMGDKDHERVLHRLSAFINVLASLRAAIAKR